MPKFEALYPVSQALRDGCAFSLTSKLLLPASVLSSSAFSTSATLHRRTPQSVKTPGIQVAKKGQRTLRLAKNKFVRDARPPAPGERKAVRKRIVLSNTNAFEVAGLQDLTESNVNQYDSIKGRVLGLPPSLVDALRSVEAFKAGQGWGFFRRPACLIREEAVQFGQWMDLIAGKWTAESGLGIAAGSTVSRIIVGDRKVGKSVLLLQAMAMAFLKGWIVISLPEGL